MWDNAKGQGVVIVQTPYGQRAADYMEEICDRLPEYTLVTDKYTEVLPGVWVMHVTAGDKARNKGCKMNGEASTYTVFGCSWGDEVCEIYQPQRQAMISSSCDIPLDVEIEIYRVTRTEGLFKKREVFTGFWEISLPQSFRENYMEGQLTYSVGEFENIPVTREMAEKGIFYVYTEERPEMHSNNRGLRIR